MLALTCDDGIVGHAHSAFSISLLHGDLSSTHCPVAITLIAVDFRRGITIPIHKVVLEAGVLTKRNEDVQ